MVSVIYLVPSLTIIASAVGGHPLATRDKEDSSVGSRKIVLATSGIYCADVRSLGAAVEERSFARDTVSNHVWRNR